MRPLSFSLSKPQSTWLYWLNTDKKHSYFFLLPIQIDLAKMTTRNKLAFLLNVLACLHDTVTYFSVHRARRNDIIVIFHLCLSVPLFGWVSMRSDPEPPFGCGAVVLCPYHTAGTRSKANKPIVFFYVNKRGLKYCCISTINKPNCCPYFR